MPDDPSQTNQDSAANPHQETPPAVPRDDNGRFLKGAVANPGGRRSGGRQLRDLARTHTQEAVETLQTLMRDEDVDAKARIKAAEVLLDRGWGRAPVQVETPAVKPIDQMDRDELAELLGTTREQIDQMMRRAEDSGEGLSLSPRIVLQQAQRGESQSEQGTEGAD